MSPYQFSWWGGYGDGWAAQAERKNGRYRLGHEVFSFVDAPLWVRELKEQDSLTVSLPTIQRLEQDSSLMTMKGSFLDCSGITSTRLLEEAMLEEGALEGTCRLVGTLLELERSRVGLLATCCPQG